MKYIKTYEKSKEFDFSYLGKWVYFKINTDKLLDKLIIAVEKTGYSNLFYKTYELPEEDEYNPNHGTFYLLFNPANEIPGRSQCSIEIYEKDFIGKYEELTYKGEISVSDYEIAAKKYNL